MTLAELLQSTPETEILAECARLDPDNGESAYQDMLERLTETERLPTKTTILIQPWEDSEFHHVGGLIPGSDETYGIEFTEWGEWLSAPVRIKDLDLTPAQIIAQCLYEMSFISFDPEIIAEERETLRKFAARIQNLDEGDDDAVD